MLFAARPYTQCPLTLDHGWLLQNLDRAEVGMIEDGTAVGSALATAVNRLRPSTAKSKFVVLLTDGQSNAGKITPQTAAEPPPRSASRSTPSAPAPAAWRPTRPRTSSATRSTGRCRSTSTRRRCRRSRPRPHARYFRATDTPTLREIYAEIDRSEKTEFEAPQYLDYRELYPVAALAGAGAAAARDRRSAKPSCGSCRDPVA